jgi:hypothetical protein
MKPSEYRKKVTNSIRESARKLIARKEKEVKKSLNMNTDRTKLSLPTNLLKGDEVNSSSENSCTTIYSMLSNNNTNDESEGYQKKENFQMKIASKNENESHIIFSSYPDSPRIHQRPIDPNNNMHSSTNSREEHFEDLISSIEDVISSISNRHTKALPHQDIEVVANDEIQVTCDNDITHSLKPNKSNIQGIRDHLVGDDFAINTIRRDGASNMLEPFNLMITNTDSSPKSESPDRHTSIAENLCSSSLQNQDRSNVSIQDTSDDSFLRYIDETLGKMN